MSLELVERALAKGVTVNFLNFEGTGGRVSVDPIGHVEWASVTFTGARRRLRVTLEGEGAVGAAADFLADLPDLELPVPGHLVADLSLVAEKRGDGGGYACLDLEALTIEDR